MRSTEADVQRCSVNKVRHATLLKKRLWHRCFPVNLAKFLRTPFLTEYLGWLLLIIERIVVYYLLTLLQALINVLKSFLEHTCFLSLFDN